MSLVFIAFPASASLFGSHFFLIGHESVLSAISRRIAPFCSRFVVVQITERGISKSDPLQRRERIASLSLYHLYHVNTVVTSSGGLAGQ
jgi:hypothetical protein